VPGREALAAITVDQPPTDTVLRALERVPDVVLVRLAQLGD